ncbi:MAG: ABC transporter substrate-binding protein [Anaerolineae bacterium]|nr:ABC transporter substrate-binding protein [Anaerolineae bacterium]
MNKSLHKSWKAILIGLVVISLALTACGDSQKTYTIGIVNVVSVLDNTVQGFITGMTDLGYIEGENVTYIHKEIIAMDDLDSVLQDMVKADVDLLMTTSTTAAKAIQEATAGTEIPVVFGTLADPVGAGFVESLKQPGGNMTGLVIGAQDDRRLGWLLDIDPAIEQVYVPYNPDDPAPVAGLTTLKEAAPKLGVELITPEIRTPDEVIAAIENIPAEADAIYLLADSLVSARASDFLEAALELQLPISDPSMDNIEKGLLTSYGPVQVNSGKQVARLADQILKGIKPSDLPVETAESYLGINLKTAEAIGLQIPEDILRQADIVVR